MKKRDKFLQFGEEVAGFNTPVLNEREIRAAAGIMFLVMFISLVFILFKKDFLLVKYVLVVFFSDFIIRVLINPRFSPTMIIGRLIVSGQVPEYVGAAQKRFAWTIGLVLSSVMFFLLIVVNAYSIFTGVTCLVCLTFLFFETAFGICLGCLFYNLVHKNKTHDCAGQICGDNKKQAIQKTSRGQIASLLAFIVYIVLAILFFSDNFQQTPKNLWDIIK
jgi:hypothetical protein